jgi:hypothetical protein
MISESVMVYVNRQKYPIHVTNSSYHKTALEKLKIDKLKEEEADYDNISLDGFEINHTLDRIEETNVQQKSLTFYLRKQLQRFMYITKNIEIKPCLLVNNLFGFHDIYHMNRTSSNVFYPVISLEMLFSKTFLLEENLPVFYNRFYKIINQSNSNKINSLESSLQALLQHIKTHKKITEQQKEIDIDKTRVKTILARVKDKELGIQKERLHITSTITDPIQASYHNRRLDEEYDHHEKTRQECNTIYLTIKQNYEKYVFEPEMIYYELFYKIKDVEQLLGYMN